LSANDSDTAPPPDGGREDSRFGPVVAWALNVAALLLVSAYVAYKIDRASSEQLRVPGATADDRVQDLLWFALLCGLAAFASLELVKRLTRLRGVFQWKAALDWFELRDARRDFDQLLALLRLTMRARDVRPLFDLPAEHVAAQISAAAETALLAGRVGPSPIGWLGISPLLEASRNDGVQDDLLVGQSMRTAVDQLQIAMADQWRRYCQGTAFVLAAVYGLGFAVIGKIDGHDQPRYIIAAAVIGGAGAWLIRDLTAIVEKARR
jgi:hypothetical protein